MIVHRNNGILWTCEKRIKWIPIQWHGKISKLFCWVKNTEGDRMSLECSSWWKKNGALHSAGAWVWEFDGNYASLYVLLLGFHFPTCAHSFFSWRKKTEKSLLFSEEKATSLEAGGNGHLYPSNPFQRFLNLSNPVAGKTTSSVISQDCFASWECWQSFI